MARKLQTIQKNTYKTGVLCPRRGRIDDEIDICIHKSFGDAVMPHCSLSNDKGSIATLIGHSDYFFFFFSATNLS